MPIPLPGVPTPENAEMLAGAASANVAGAGGFEGMALDASGGELYTLLERPVARDRPRTLRIDQFDLATEAYTGVRYRAGDRPAHPAGRQRQRLPVRLGGRERAADDTEFLPISLPEPLE